MKNTILILFAVFVISCGHDKEYYKLKKENTELSMDLGVNLWKRKIIQYNGNVEKADSAYSVDKKILIDDIYKTSERVEKKGDTNEKECGHIFFNRYCHSCKEYRLKN